MEPKRPLALRLASLAAALLLPGGLFGWAWFNGLRTSWAVFGPGLVWTALAALAAGVAGYGLGRNQRAVRWPEDGGRAAWLRGGSLVAGIGMLIAHLVWFPAALPVLPLLALGVVLGGTLWAARQVPGEQQAGALGRGLARVLALGLVLIPLVPLWLSNFLALELPVLQASLAAALVLCLSGLAWSLGRVMTGLTSLRREERLPTEAPEAQADRRGTVERQRAEG